MKVALHKRQRYDENVKIMKGNQHMIILQEVKDVARNEDGNIFTWRTGEVIAEFNTYHEATDYLRANRYILQNREIRFFTGSCSLMVILNSFLDDMIEQEKSLQSIKR